MAAPQVECFVRRFGSRVAAIAASGTAAAWAQTLIAGLALIFAYSSVESWREQELAKRQAEIASNLTTRISSLHSVFAAMLPEAQQYADADLVGENSILKAVYSQPAYFQFLSQAKELKLFSDVVSGTIPDEGLQIRLRNLVGELEAVASCVQRLRSLDREAAESKSSSIWRARAMSALAAFALLPDQMSIVPNRNVCNFEVNDIDDQMGQIQKLTAPFLTMSPKASRG